MYAIDVCKTISICVRSDNNKFNNAARTGCILQIHTFGFRKSGTKTNLIPCRTVLVAQLKQKTMKFNYVKADKFSWEFSLKIFRSLVDKFMKKN